MTRRDALMATAGLAVAPIGRSAASAGRLKQSVARWCFAKTPLEDLCRQAAEIGIVGIDLVDPPEWPAVQKYGLTPAMTTGAGTIPSGWNRKENHDRLEKQMQATIAAAAQAKLPNVITFSGNRAGLSDQEGKENCIAGLRRVKKIAEDQGVTVCMELLNSKIDHKDYQCDHTSWGVDVIKGVDSPRVKLLYDIYHMQIMEGDIIRTIRQNIQYIGHFHTGGVPGRHEMDETQEINYRAVAAALAQTGYARFVAHELMPVGDKTRALEQSFQIFG